MATAPDDDANELLAMAGDSGEADLSAETPRCLACGSALDDVAKMTDKEVLLHMRTEFYRDLFRNLRTGISTHQEKAIVRGILRDNKIIADDDDEGDDDTAVNSGRRRKARSSETYSFEAGHMDETEGG